MTTIRTSSSLLALAATALVSFAGAASATEGYSQNGFGARNKALAGAGVADSRDATAGSLNPAGLVHVGDELDVAVSVFSPRRGFTGSGAPGFTPTGEVESDRDFFFMPNLAYNTRAYKNPLFDVVNFTMIGNGGMNTSYPAVTNNGAACPGPGTGVFCAGASGVNLMQMVMSVGFAKQITPGIAIGVAPMFALQGFQARGIEAFGLASIDPANLSGSVNDWSMGGGVRGGIEISPMQNVRIGIAGTTPIWMQKFESYRGLFANQGEFDVPASIQAGIAVDVSPQLTFMLDWRYIWFSSVDAVGNPSTNILLCGPGPAAVNCLGGSNGPGFGWDDINVIKVAMEYRANDKLTLRAGYAWNEQPVNSRDVMLNILAPAVTQHHITGGFEYVLGGGYSLEMAGMFAPKGSVSGTELPGFGNPAHNIELEMWQFDVTAGVKYKWDEPAPLK